MGLDIPDSAALYTLRPLFALPITRPGGHDCERDGLTKVSTSLPGARANRVRCSGILKSLLACRDRGASRCQNVQSFVGSQRRSANLRERRIDGSCWDGHCRMPGNGPAGEDGRRSRWRSMYERQGLSSPGSTLMTQIPVTCPRCMKPMKHQPAASSDRTEG